MNKINYLFTCLLLVILSCNNKGPNVTEKTIKTISKITPGLPALYGQLFMFVSVEKGKIGCTDINVLNEIYPKHYYNEYKSFDLFLLDVLNQKKIISQQDLNNRNVFYFELDKRINDDYNNSSIMVFINKYCVKKSEISFSLKREYNSRSYLYTILYFFFINDYGVTVDDYIGEYKIFKITQ